MPLNVSNHRRQQSRNRPRRQQNNVNPRSCPLNEHPKWMAFVQDLGATILNRYPDLRQPFLELLDRADVL